MKKYFLHNGSEQQGPFDIEELKSQKITNKTPIWFDGLTEWTAAGEIEELKNIITGTPPPFMNKKISTPLNSESTTQAKVNIDKPKKRNPTGRLLLIIGGIILMSLIGLLIFNQIQHQQYQNHRDAEENQKAMIRNNITAYVTAERSNYQYSELGGIYNLQISVNNNTNYLIDNVKVKVIYIKANGNVWNSRILDFNLLAPWTKSTIKVPDTERGTSVQYEITSIKSVALGLN